MQTPERRLCAFLAALGGDSLPASARGRVGTALLDWFCAGWAGATQPEAARLRHLAVTLHGAGPAPAFGAVATMSATAAAFANAAISHLREMDDGHRLSMLHPGIVAIPPVLALAADRPMTAGVAASAIVAGYETVIRIGTALGPGHYRRFHSTATAGALGAAAAAGVALGLDAGRLQHALGIAATQAAGLWQFNDDGLLPAKALHPAFAVRNGLAAALAAQQGFPGAQRFFTGSRGLAAMLGGDGDVGELDRDFGRPLRLETTTIKNWPACGQVFTALDALQALRSAHGLGADDVARVDVRIYPQALEVARVDWPAVPAECAFSLRYCLASLLIRGRVDDAGAGDAALADLGARIRIEADAGYGRAFPGRRPCTVSVRTRDGREFAEAREFRRGDPEDPLGRDDLVARFRDAAPQAGEARIDAIARWCDALAQGGVAESVTLPAILFG